MFTGSEDRQHAYVALTRGTDDNTAYVFTTPTKLSDPAPGARPAPELARYDRLTAQAGDPAPGDRDDPGTTSPVSVLAEMITGRDGAAQSASQAWRQALADADHLAVLHAIWDSRDHARPRTALPRPAPVGAPRREPASRTATRSSGCTGRCAPPSSRAWTRARSWPGRSPSGT